LGAQAGILTTSLCTFVLAALFAERRRHEAALTEGAARLQEALTAGGVTAFEWMPATVRQMQREAAKILGYDPQAPFTAAHFLARIHPTDRAHFKAHVRSVRPTAFVCVTFRVTRPDGQEMWLEETATAEFDAAGTVSHQGLTSTLPSASGLTSTNAC